MIVAIDGPAGSGKSTVAHEIARRQHLTYLDTGAMYRAVTWRCLEQGIDLADAGAVARVAQNCSISFGASDEGQTVSIDGEDVTRQIRTPEVDRSVSVVSAIPAVRASMVALQREVGEAGDVVAEGRDIGTTVFPRAEVKVFLTADARARAHRRAVQREGKDSALDANVKADAKEEQEILEDLERRDQLDSTRKESPLRPAEDAVHIDSSTLTVDEVVSQIEDLMKQVRSRTSRQVAGMAVKDEAARQADGQAPLEADAKNVDGHAPDGRAPGDATEGPADKPSANPQAIAQPDPQAQVEIDPQPETKVRPGVEGQTGRKGASKAFTKASGAGSGEGRLHAFRGNSIDDYFDHGMREYPVPARMLLGFCVWVVAGVTKLLWRWQWEDIDKLWGDKKGRVIVMNHVSMLEPVVVIVSGYLHGCRVRTVYKSEFNKVPLAEWFFSRAGAIPVTRGTADLKVLRRAQAALKRGEFVLIYPEGTRIRTDDQPVEIHGGFALMAQMGRADVQPCAVVGARDITPEGSHLKRLCKVWLKAGDPISFSELSAKGRKAKVAEMEKVSMEEVYRLRGELRAEHPGKM